MPGTRRAFLLISLITIFRIAAAPVLLLLLFTGRFQIFKWLLAACFFTDLIDGVLARKFRVASVLGTRLDSIGDDLTVFVAVIAMFVHFPEFIRQELFVIIIMMSLFLLELTMSLIRYRKISSFHTYGAKLAAFVQGLFLLSSFFFHQPNLHLFQIAAVVTTFELVEEIILVIVLPEWKANVKGLYWVMKEKKI